MVSDIPEYYRHLAEKRESEEDQEYSAPGPRARTGTLAPRAAPEPFAAQAYVANRFVLALSEEWTDATIYILSGPVVDDIQHNITIMVDPHVITDSLEEYADLQIRPLEEELKGCRILLREAAQLSNGMPAHRVIYSWCPVEECRFYQEQLYVLHDGVGFKLTATFTRKTRKTLGPQVERMMLSFEPRSPDGDPPTKRR